jgi:hypothetical protein
MFRYSRDVKRCGPGTKAGAPVGVVYCLSTSSFFILTLTPELDVFRVRYRRPPYKHIGGVPQLPPVRTVEPVTASSIIAKSCAMSGRRAASNILPHCSRACSALLPSRRGTAYQVFLDSMAARASAKLSRIRSRMILGASLLDFLTSSATSLVFLTVASNTRLANSACLAATS